MSGRRAVLVWALIAALTAVMLIWLSPFASSPSTAEPEAPSDSRPASLAAGRTESSPTASRLAITSSEPSSRIPRPGDLLELTGRVIDEREQPVAGAEVVVLRNQTLSVALLDPELGKAHERAAEQRTGVDGRFAFRLARAQPFELRVAARGFARERVLECYAAQDLTVTLRAGAQLRGRVFWKSEQRALAGVPVRGFLVGVDGNELEGTSAADGSFAFSDVRPGEYYVEVIPREGELPPSRKLQLVGGEVVTADFAIQAGEITRGRVTDATSGAPIAGAELGHGWTFRRPVRTDVRGEYVIEGYPSEDGDELHARADGFGRQQKRLVRASKERVLDFALAPAFGAHGRIVDAHGEPFAGAYVAAVAYDMDHSSGAYEQKLDWQATRSAHDGRFACRSLRTDLRHVLYVRADAHGTLVYDFPSRAAAGVTVDLGDVQLAREGVLEGFLHESDGRPVKNAPVSLKGTNADRSHLVAEPARAALRQQDGSLPGGFYVDSRMTRTDARGEFRIGALAAGSYKLTIGERRGVTLERSDVVVPAGEVTSLDLIFERGLSIEGRVTGGGIADGVELHVRAEAERPQDGKWHESSARVRKDSTFVLAGLRDGLYRIELSCTRRGEDVDAPYGSVIAEHIQAGTRDLAIVLEPAVFVSGIVLDEDGKPLAGARVYPSYSANRSPRSSRIVASDAQGRFKLKVFSGGLVAVHAYVSDGRVALALEMQKRRAKVEGVAPGAVDVVLRIEKAK